jgi:hypothetical protein
MADLSFLPLKRQRQSGMSNAGWRYDAYPELKSLDAGACIELAALEGPGIITCFHITQHHAVIDGLQLYLATGNGETAISGEEVYKATARGLILEIYYNGNRQPAVRCPLADFFADGCQGKCVSYSTPFVEKMPRSYNSYIPMPFEQSIRVTLRNETAYNCLSYSFIEYERLPEWNRDLLYFHCAWQQKRITLTPDTVFPLIHIPGRGHLFGAQYSISTAEPVFKDFFFIMEGNVEHRIDGEDRPSLDYLGTEDSFGFSWGFQQICCGLRSGINYLQTSTQPIELSIYRFRDHNPINFNSSLDIRINWQHEFTYGKTSYQNYPRSLVWQAVEKKGAGVEYATTHYYYLESAFDGGN